MLNPKQKYNHNYRLIYRLRTFTFITIFILLIFSNSAFSQEANISLYLQNVSVSEVFSEIEKITHYSFAYDNTEIDLNRKVSINVSNSSIENILNILFENTAIYYKISSKHILLVKAQGVDEKVSENQYFKISGTVHSKKDKEPIPGVNIVEKGTMNGTVSDIYGNFIMTVRSKESLIQFSTIGYVIETIPLNGQSEIHLEMTEQLETLEEVVIIGYGSQKKIDLTSSIASISTSDIQRFSVADFSQALQGLASGIEVVSNRGGPGEGAIVRVRGTGSINNTNPLYVIDGFPIVETSYDFGSPSVSALNTLNPYDIEQVEVLKDASACAIYGTRGANGVILITTKKGNPKKTTISYQANYGMQSVSRKIEVLNAQQYAILNNEINQNAINSGIDGVSLIPVSADPYNMPYNTDWQDEIFRIAPIKNQSVSISGGNENIIYHFSGNYFNQDGILLETGYKKYNFRLNSEINKGRLKLGESIGFTRSYKSLEKEFNGSPVLLYSIEQIPALPVYDENAIGGFAGTTADLHAVNIPNPVGAAKLLDNDLNTNTLLANIYGQIKIFKGLYFKLNMGFDYINFDNTRYAYKYVMGSYNINLDADLEKRYNERITTLVENTLHYSNSIGKHKFEFLTGYTNQYSKREYFVGSSSGFPDDKIRSLDLGTLDRNVEGNWSEFAIRSYLGRVIYNYDDKYLLTMNIRRDGSSKFSKKNKWSTFPSISAAWRISKENFFNEPSFINDLKIRASYGLIGNQEIGDYQYESSLNFYAGYVLGTDQQRVTGVVPSTFANEEIKWETTKQTDLGFDIGLIKNKLQITIDYYLKNTDDMLLQVPIPLSTGNSSPPPFTNAGSLKCSGFEVSGTYKNESGKLKYQINSYLSTTKNEVVKLGKTGEPIWGGNFDRAYITRTAEGQPIGQFYGYITDGIYNTYDEILAMNKTIIDENGQEVYNQFAPYALPGDIRFKDLNNDGLLTEMDKDYIGNPFPDFSYGLKFSTEFNNFDIYIHIHGIYGNEIFMATIKWLEGMHSNSNSGISALDHWTPTHTNTNIPRPIATDPNNNLAISDRYVKDGSYTRIKNITIGYTINNNLLSKLKVEKFRIYIQGQNILTFTKYPGWDPEIGSYGLGQSERNKQTTNLSRGIDNGYYPQSRAILLGLTMEF